MNRSDIWAVVPVKAFHLAKTRLAPFLTRTERQELSAAMLRDVLSALAAVPTLAGTRVVTRDPAAVRIAAGFGAETMPGPAARGPTLAVAAAARGLADEGRHGMLAVMGDVPLATPAALTDLLANHGHTPAVTLVPAADGRGCNAALVTPPDGLALTFDGQSLAQHQAMANALGINARTAEVPELALDIDDTHDLAAFLRHAGETRTASFLRAIGAAERWHDPIQAAPVPEAMR